MFPKKDKDAVRAGLLNTLERLAEAQPVTDITLRELAEGAGVSHTTVLRYFNSKRDIMTAMAKLQAEHLYASVDGWFASHSLKDYRGKTELLDGFFADMQISEDAAANARAASMLCTLSACGGEVGDTVRAEILKIEELIADRLRAAFGKAPGKQELYSVYVALFGILFSAAAGALPEGGTVKPVSGFFRLMLP